CLKVLLHKGASFVWGEEQCQCFQLIKDEVCNAGILVPFDTKRKTIITVDASAVGTGAVLSQMHGSVEKIVAFASRTLTTAERHLAVIERETLAATMGVEYFRTYIWGSAITLRSDHKPLLKILSPGGSGKGSARLARL
ncbi:hypothetical protein NDU88_007992, partial [Pleurodeles waltl]